MPHGAVALASRRSSVVVLPDEGGVAVDLVVDGLPVLARTPWADDVVGSSEPARDEAEWVARWRGGWQVCLPTTGQPDAAATPAQGFHGTASQASWSVVERTRESVTLRWMDAADLHAVRTWTLTDAGLGASTTLTNDGGTRLVAVAEHLILGGGITDAIIRDGGVMRAPADASIAELDYDGMPSGRVSPWPGEGWSTVTRTTSARVGALLSPHPMRVTLGTSDMDAEITWTGLPHALIWEELGRSIEAPWNSAVFAIGVEPTTTPHGAGTRHGAGHVVLEPGASLNWTAALRIAAARASSTPKESS